MKTTIALSLSALLIACGGETELVPEPVIPAEPPPPPEPDHLAEARGLFPRALELHTGVIARSCSPNPGVCHQANNYPDLRTAGGLLALVRAPCNVELPDPEQGWDACEQAADVIRAGTFATQIAWLEQKSAGTWRVGLREAPDVTGRQPVEIYAGGDEEPMFVAPVTWDVGVDLVAGEREADLTAGYPDAYLTSFIDGILATVRGGDLNKNGVYGAEGEAAGALITPGSLEHSYLWGRVTGTVPGSRMPLANQPLSQPEYIALACWIEGLARTQSPGALDAIDYDACAFARDPVFYAR